MPCPARAAWSCLPVSRASARRAPPKSWRPTPKIVAQRSSGAGATKKRVRPPYWPWVQAIRAYVQQCDAGQLRSEMGHGAANIADVIPEIHDKITDLKPSPNLEPEAARFRLFDSISTFLKNAAQSQPLMLVLDDLHWADKPSLLLLQFLARELAPTQSGRLLVVGTYRDVELSRQHPLSETLAQLSRSPGGGFKRVVLRGLDYEDTAQLIEASAGIEPTTGLVEALYSHAEGNPFFMTEVIRLLSESGELTAEHIGTPEGLRIPEGVREVIGQRLNRLSEQCNEVLTTASIIGREFDFRLLNILSSEMSEDQLLQAVDEAVSFHLIEDVPGRMDRYRFSHALIQQTLVEEVTTSRRVRLHARIGEALEELYGDDAESHAAELATISLRPRHQPARVSWFATRYWPASGRWRLTPTRTHLLILKGAWSRGI